MLGNKTEKKAIKFIRYEERFINYEWNHYKTVLIILIVLLTLESYLSGTLQKFFNSLGEYGYIGGFIAGFLYSYGVTTPFAIAAFVVLAKQLDIWLLIILGSLGGLIGEYFIYDFAKKESGKSLRIYKNKTIKIPEIKSKLFRRLSPLIAGLIIATPIPDEFLAFLFGIEKYRLRDFLILTIIFKLIGTFLIVGLGRII
jgi:uncharacterized membrane protein YdjX (TVP38/TMEM64 family)